jgi:MFS family permease
MVAIATLAQNCALGLSFASYGTLIGSFETEFQTTRALASSGLGAMVLSMSLCGPLVGMLLRHFSLRTIMITGALLGAAGYFALALASSIGMTLAIYGLLVGPSACFLGIVPAATLVGNWFVKDRGKALGLINMPILLFVMPPVFGRLVSTWGADAVFYTIAAILLCSVAALAFIVDTPESVGQSPSGIVRPSEGVAIAEPPPMTMRAMMKLPSFWLLGIGIGLLNSGGTVIVTHFVSLGLERGIPIESGALLVSAFGGAGIIGAVAFGWLVDRIGATRTLVVNAVLQAVLWAGLIPPFGLSALLPLSAILGACTGAIVGVFGAAISEMFGRANLSTVMGSSYLLKLPFIVIAAPLAGYLFDTTGSYFAAFVIHIAAFALAALIFLRMTTGRASPAQQGTSVPKPAKI